MSLLDLPSDINEYTLHFLPIIDLYVQMYVCKCTKKIAVKLLRDGPSLLYMTMCTEAARHNYFGVLKWLVSTKHKIRDSTIDKAAKRGYLDILKWALKNGNVRITHTVYYSAAKSGKLELFKWLMEYDPRHPVRRCLDWLRNVKPGNPKYAIDSVIKGATRSGNLELLQYLLIIHHTPNFYTLILNTAARHGHIHIIKWYIDRCGFVDYDACIAAVLSGNVDFLKYAEGYNFQLDGVLNNAVLNNAVSSRSIPMIEYVVGKNELPQNYLVRSGDVHILRWFKERGYRCANLCLIDASSLGQEQTIKWLAENGHDISFNDIFVSAIKHGYTHILETFKEKWPQNNSINCYDMDITLQLDFSSAIEITNWIRINKCPTVYDYLINVLRISKKHIKRHNLNFDLYSE